jgi:hypothetical protein
MLLTKRERMPAGRTAGLSGASAALVADDRSGAIVDWVFVSIATGARTARPWISRRRVSAPDTGDATGSPVDSRKAYPFVGSEGSEVAPKPCPDPKVWLVEISNRKLQESSTEGVQSQSRPETG